MNDKKRGKRYAFIDNVVMFCLTMTYWYFTAPLLPYYSAFAKGPRLTDYVSHVVDFFFLINTFFVFKKTAYLNSKRPIPNERKYIVGSYYFLIILSGFIISLLSNNYIITKASEYLSFQKVNKSLIFLYVHYFIALIFGIIRWYSAFDYYEAIYYQNKKSLGVYVYLWLFLLILVYVLIFCLWNFIF